MGWQQWVWIYTNKIRWDKKFVVVDETDAWRKEVLYIFGDDINNMTKLGSLEYIDVKFKITPNLK